MSDEAIHLDVTCPSVARMHNYLLGGPEHFAVDRHAVEEALQVLPNLHRVVVSARVFLHRAVRHLAEAGVRQFLDLGTGVPHRDTVHQVAKSVVRGARVVYVDNDPIVAVNAYRLRMGAATALVEADLRDPAAVLKHPDTLALIDFDAPVGLLFGSVLHFIEDADDPHGIVAAFRGAVAPGSYVVVSHAERRPETLRAAGAFQRATAPLTPRPRAQIEALLDGWELVEPGWGPVSHWRLDGPYHGDPAEVWMLGGVGRKL